MPEQVVLGTPVEFVGEVDPSPDAYIAEVNHRRAAFRWSNAVIAAALLLAAALAVDHGAGGWYAIPIVIAIVGAVLRHRENDERSIILTYELEGDAAGNRVSAVSYAQLRLDVRQDNFREDGPLPADATIVGTTWLFVNKNGSPDRRFNNNRQIPIVAYSELSIEHSAFAFILQFSKKDVAARVAATLKLLGEE